MKRKLDLLDEKKWRLVRRYSHGSLVIRHHDLRRAILFADRTSNVARFECEVVDRVRCFRGEIRHVQRFVSCRVGQTFDEQAFGGAIDAAWMFNGVKLMLASTLDCNVGTRPRQLDRSRGEGGCAM